MEKQTTQQRQGANKKAYDAFCKKRDEIIAKRDEEVGRIYTYYNKQEHQITDAFYREQQNIINHFDEEEN